MPSVFCDGCGYRYNLSDKKPLPRKCPYCNKVGTVKLVKTAQDWLNEISEMK